MNVCMHILFVSSAQRLTPARIFPASNRGGRQGGVSRGAAKSSGPRGGSLGRAAACFYHVSTYDMFIRTYGYKLAQRSGT